MMYKTPIGCAQAVQPHGVRNHGEEEEEEEEEDFLRLRFLTALYLQLV